MKKILIITGEFPPYRSANTNCLLHVIEALQASGYDVSVLSFAYGKDIPIREDRDGYSIYRVYASNDRFDKLYRVTRDKSAPIAFLGKWIAMIAFKCIWVIRIRKSVCLYRRTLRREEFPYILSVLYPQDGHFIAERLADKHTKWVMYNLDPYISQGSHGLTLRYKKFIENHWRKKVSGIINLHGVRLEHEQIGYDPYRGLPTLDTHLPNLAIPSELPARTQKQDGEKILLRFTGSFHPYIRRPETLLQILEKLDSDQFTAEFYGGACDYLKNNFSSLPACVRLMGSVDEKACRTLTGTADILINVGNLTTDQFPSKVFEYIATGKPILNVYSEPNDPVLPYMQRYPCALNVRSADEIDGETLLRLYRNAASVTAEQLREIYRDNLRETVTKTMIDFIESL